MMEPDDQQYEKSCPVFGVKSGGPIIGLGFLLILFAIIPYLIIPGSMPALIAILFAGFGIFLIWAGIAK
jgi:hypothetical protein